ncbi:MAG TPA: hypothetical protein VKQ52_10460, partial [Puia sp.]|nr:hypothetical protein [Puia sp.]
MRWRNDKTGFDDRWVISIGIPIFSLVIPIIFFGWRIGMPPYLAWNVYWPALVITATVWIGSRYIMIWARTRYPQFREVKKRLWVQMSVILLFVLFVNNVLGALLDCDAGLRDSAHQLTQADILIDSNAATILCTLLVTAIYESIYFVSELRKSIEEKELLKRESLQAQVNALKIQVNPHFLFNT